MSLALRFTRRFCMAHRLASGASAKCATPHGHNEQVSVELEPKAPATLDGAKNMVAEFAAAKRRWHRWIDERVDHALQLWEMQLMAHANSLQVRVSLRYGHT